MSRSARPQILLVTSLYPLDENDTENSRALHNFVLRWRESADIIVVRPYFFNPPKKRFFPPHLQNRIDGVRVFHLPTFSLMGVPARWGGLNLSFSVDWGVWMLFNRAFRPDIVLSHLRPSHMLGEKLARLFRVPLVMGFHASDVMWSAGPARRIARKADLLVSRSPSLVAKVRDLVPHARAPIFVANSGISEAEIVPRQDVVKKAEGWTDVTQFMSVGQFVPRKNFDKVLTALAGFRHLPWHYTIIGDGPGRGQLTSLTRELGLESRVDFLGYRPRTEVLEHLTRAHVFLMPSDPETFGLAFLEAMARGCVVMCAKNWGVDGLIENGVSGFAVDPKSQGELTAVLERVLQAGPQERAALLLASHETVGGLTDEVTAGDYLQRITEIISANRTANRKGVGVE